ncbi:hypothetical protein ACWX0K_10885 [Nitrobacteraceae bacterium UC4446_H13]
MAKKTRAARPSMAAMTKLTAELAEAREEIARLRTVKEKWFDAYHALQKESVLLRQKLTTSSQHLFVAGEVFRLANMPQSANAYGTAAYDCVRDMPGKAGPNHDTSSANVPSRW